MSLRLSQHNASAKNGSLCQARGLEQEFEWSPKPRSRKFPEEQDWKMGRTHTWGWILMLIRILPPLACSHNIDRLLRVPRGLEPIPEKKKAGGLGLARPMEAHR